MELKKVAGEYGVAVMFKNMFEIEQKDDRNMVSNVNGKEGIHILRCLLYS
jgi:hypothetical protein